MNDPNPQGGPPPTVGETVIVNVNTGEAALVEGGGFLVLPVRPGVCPWCHAGHDPAVPHDQQSLAYRMQFYSAHGRWPTWTDAMSHCDDATRRRWRAGLRAEMARHGMAVPPDLSPELDPPADPEGGA